MKLTVLWSSLASYSVAFFRELASSQGCELQLIYHPIRDYAPYERFDLSFCRMALEASDDVKERLDSLLGDFNPESLLMTSWNFPNYMRASRKLRKKGGYVISTMDNQWRGTPKQYLGVLASRWFLKPSIDTFLVAGDRQADFARRLGYENVMYGLYAAEVDKFSGGQAIEARPRSFLFAGRLIPAKGIEILAESYMLYRQHQQDPWPLKVVGDGPLEGRLHGLPGVEMMGFVQPDQMPSLMQRVSCLVLPSRFEPWGVVIHEAAAAGLPIIATRECGATTMFVRDGLNGFIVSANAASLATAMLRISRKSTSTLEVMSGSSQVLAGLWSPGKLAAYFVEETDARLRGSIPLDT